MAVCAVSTCKNYFRKSQDSGIVYHRFPKDSKLQKIWIARCKRADKINTVCGRICSIHFVPDDYERDLKNELLNLPCKKRLKLNAVPTLHLNPSKQTENQVANTRGDSNTQQSQIIDSTTQSDSTNTNSLDRESRCKAREIRKRALERLKNLPPIEKTKDQETNTDFIDDEKIALQKKVIKLQKRVQLVEKNLERTLQRYEEMKNKKDVALRQCKIDLIKTKIALRQSEKIINAGEKTKSKKPRIKPASRLKSPNKKTVSLPTQPQGKTLPQRILLPATVQNKIVPVTIPHANISVPLLPQKIPIAPSPQTIPESLMKLLLNNSVLPKETENPITPVGNDDPNETLQILVVSSS